MRTARDFQDHLIDWLGDQPSGTALAQARRSVQEALRELANAFNWTYYYASLRVDTVAPYKTGTIQYTNSSRIVTLTGGTFPSWAQLGVLVVSNVAYDIQSRDSTTQLTLATTANPGIDVAAGTAYALYQDYYPLPCDFRALAGLTISTRSSGLEHIHPREWHRLQRRNVTSEGTPVSYTILGDNKYLGVMGIAFWPYASEVYHVDATYIRYPRPPKTFDYSDGTITSTLNGVTVTGNGTVFTAGMQGCVLRASGNAVDFPTDVEGANPKQWEHTILSVNTAAQTLTLDAGADSALTAVKYMISDPIDVDEGVMMNALFRCAEKNLAQMRRVKDVANASTLYFQALEYARAADTRTFELRGPGGRQFLPLRPARWPLGADVSS